jgi:hypothetical protein
VGFVAVAILGSPCHIFFICFRARANDALVSIRAKALQCLWHVFWIRHCDPETTMKTDTRLEWCLVATVVMIVMAAGIHVFLLP